MKMLTVALFLASASLVQAADSAEKQLSDFIEASHSKQRVVKSPQGLLKHEYLVPDGPYNQLFDWDMYFMGVALSYDGVGKPVAGSVQCFLDYVGGDPETGKPTAGGHFLSWNLLAQHMVEEAEKGTDPAAIHVP